jgi:E3 SUMO-protein ligase PIAS1
MKGLKKKPGTAPPPDIGKYARTVSVANRVEMVYVNSQQPVSSKVNDLSSLHHFCAEHLKQKYYMIVMLVETINIETLVKNLRTHNLRSRQEIQQKSKVFCPPQWLLLTCFTSGASLDRGR